MGGCTSIPAQRSLEKATHRVEKRSGAVQAFGRYHKLPKRLEDDYELHDDVVLGVGMNGAVYLGKNRATGTKAAVKSFALKGLSGKNKQRLVKEVETFLSMDHPHVARLLDVYESSDALHLVMEILSGGELFDRVQQSGGTFSESSAAAVIKQILLVVSYVHGHSIVHRDLKLHNFLFEAEDSDHLKLIDFGVSKVFKADQASYTSLGTLGYMAPEVLDEEGLYTNKCDIFSIGVMAFIMLAGYMPFWGKASEQLRMMQTVNPMKHGPKDRWDQISPEARDLVQKMLTKSPCNRPSAHELLQHEWIVARPSVPRYDSLGASIAPAFTKFAQASRFRRACLLLMAWSCTDASEIAELRQAFCALDQSQCGRISLHDLRSSLEEKFELPTSDLEVILKSLDTNQDETIHYTDFLAAMASHSQALQADYVLQEAFRRLDTDGKGYVTQDDFQNVMGEDAELKSPRAKIQFMRQISFGDFQEYVVGSPVELSETPTAISGRKVCQGTPITTFTI
jgi:calcium-dependent protein kinase